MQSPQLARGVPPPSGDSAPCKKIPLVLSTQELTIAQLFQSQVTIQSATWFRYFWCVFTPFLVNVLVCVITWDIAWGFAKVRQEKGLREKAADIIWSIRSSELPRSQQWMPPQCGEDSLCQKIRQLICYSHVFWSKIEWSRFTLSNKPIQIDSVRSRDVLQVWASSFFDHLNHCRSVFEYVESGWVWTVGNVGWYVVNWLNNIVRMWVRRNDSFAYVTLKVSPGWLTGCLSKTFPKLKSWWSIHT